MFYISQDLRHYIELEPNKNILHIFTYMLRKDVKDIFLYLTNYFTSNTTIDLAGKVTFKAPLAILAPLKALGATTFGFSNVL